MKIRILLVDDDSDQRDMLTGILAPHYQVTVAHDGHDAQKRLQKDSFDLVITDQVMPGLTGLELTRWLQSHAQEIPVLLLTGLNSFQLGFEALKAGAADYLIKNRLNPDELLFTVNAVISQRDLRKERRLRLTDMGQCGPAVDPVAHSDASRRVIHLADRVATRDTTVLLTGETGVGKEVMARYIHSRSSRRERPFVPVNCAALPATLLESALFGHEAGAFTGAVKRKLGLFELAHGGTIFLDEIGEMTIDTQPALLRVLEDHSIVRVGSARQIHIDTRVIAATNTCLQEAVKNGRFREDLFHRLNAFPIPIPPLRERREDIPQLIDMLLQRLQNEMGRVHQNRPKTLSPATRDRLVRHDWPGNIRALRNELERALIIAAGDEIQPDDLTPHVLASLDSGDTPKTLAEIEKVAILDRLSENSGNRTHTARQLGISLRSLQMRLAKYRSNGEST